MYKALLLLIVCTLVLGLTGSTALADEHEMDAAEVVETIYAAVEAQDLATAADYVADDAVLVLIPPPPDSDGTFVGKEAVLGWFENLIQSEFSIELSNAEVSGNRVTMTNLTWVDDLPVAPVEFDGSGVVHDGKLKAINWVMTPKTLAELDAAFAMAANEEIVRRYFEELFNEADLAAVDELISEDFVSHTFPAGEGREFAKELIIGFKENFPGVTIVLDEVTLDGNRAFIVSHIVGPEGAPEGAEVESYIEDVIVLDIEDGMVTDRWWFVPPE